MVNRRDRSDYEKLQTGGRMDKIKTTLSIAKEYHEGQVRKYTGLPYINHPMAVMFILAKMKLPVELLQAALLHDVIEDCGATAQDLLDKGFTSKVVGMVVELSDVSVPSDGNRATRKSIDREYLSKASDDSKTVKLADIIDNTRSIVEHDKKFARVYLQECMLLMEVLKGGDESLYKRCGETLQRAWDELECSNE